MVILRQFTSITGLTDLMKGLPLLPFHLIEHVFINKDGDKSMLHDLFSPSDKEGNKKPGFF